MEIFIFLFVLCIGTLVWGYDLITGLFGKDIEAQQKSIRELKSFSKTVLIYGSILGVIFFVLTQESHLKEKSELESLRREIAENEMHIQSGRQAIELEKNKCLNIKGNVSKTSNVPREKIYHLPGCENYNDVTFEPERGEQIFCTEAAAIAAGSRKAKNCS